MDIPTKESINKAFNSFIEEPTDKSELITLANHFHKTETDIKLTENISKVLDYYSQDRRFEKEIRVFQQSFIEYLKD